MSGLKRVVIYKRLPIYYVWPKKGCHQYSMNLKVRTRVTAIEILCQSQVNVPYPKLFQWSHQPISSQIHIEVQSTFV